MNIGGREVGKAAQRRMADLHFQVRGPIVAQLARAFAIDWRFAAGEELRAAASRRSRGTAVCRVITDGPGRGQRQTTVRHPRARCRWRAADPHHDAVFHSAAGADFGAAGGGAARGEVCLVLPERSNLRYVDWASRRWLPPLLESGVRIYLQPAPFSHTKLLVVDGAYAQIGSANMDPRSLRLNFEIAVEIYCAANLPATGRLRQCRARGIDRLHARARERLSLPARARNSLFWLLSPYL